MEAGKRGTNFGTLGSHKAVVMRWLPRIAAPPESVFLPLGAANCPRTGHCGRKSNSKEVMGALCHQGVKWVSLIRKFWRE